MEMDLLRTQNFEKLCCSSNNYLECVMCGFNALLTNYCVITQSLIKYLLNKKKIKKREDKQ